MLPKAIKLKPIIFNEKILATELEEYFKNICGYKKMQNDQLLYGGVVKIELFV